MATAGSGAVFSMLPETRSNAHMFQTPERMDALRSRHRAPGWFSIPALAHFFGGHKVSPTWSMPSLYYVVSRFESLESYRTELMSSAEEQTEPVPPPQSNRRILFVLTPHAESNVITKVKSRLTLAHSGPRSFCLVFRDESSTF